MPPREGVDFWETWVDERSKSPAEPAPGAPPERSARSVEDEAVQAEVGTTRLYLNLGRRDRVRGPDVERLLAERVGLAEPARIQVRNTHTYVIVKDADVERVVSGLNGGKHGDRDLVCEPARPGR
jgi:hypothetical protein